MTADGIEQIERRAGGPRRAVFLDLFFDLVFIFALTRLSVELINKLTWAGAFETLLLLLALFWVWTLTAWTTDAFDPQRPAVQLQVVVVMFGALVLALAAPDAYGRRGPVFAGTYVGIHLFVSLYYLALLRGGRARSRSLRVLFWACLSTVPWLVGALVHGAARSGLWALAVAMDYTAAFTGWPTPGLGRSPLADFALSGEHVAERYRQFLIIALGETILVMGAAFARGDFEANRIAALVVAFVITALLGRIYIYRAGELLENAISAAAEPTRRGRSASYVHVVMVAGVVVTAVGGNLVIDHPWGNAPAALITAVLGGPALFLVGRVLLDYAVFGRPAWSRLVGVILLAAMTPGMFWLPPLAVASSTAVVLAVVVALDILAWRVSPSPLPSAVPTEP